jgi:hypothetical protein
MMSKSIIDILSLVKSFESKMDGERGGLGPRLMLLTDQVGLEISRARTTIIMRKSEYVCKFEEAWCLPLT